MKLPPLIRWPGGQSNLARKLEPMFPEHDTYVEPFFGGGAFYWRKEPAETEAIGDTSSWNMKFHDDVRKGKLRRCSDGIVYSRKTYEKARNGTTACDRLAVSAMGFAGQAGGFDHTRAKEGKILYTSKLKKLDRYEGRLRRTFLTTGSFERTMKKFDSPSAWHLLDPPWPNTASTANYEGKLTVDPKEVADVCRKMKGTVWVLYNNDPSVREAFQDFHIYKTKERVLHPTAGKKDFTKLLITNRPLKKKPKGFSQLAGLDLAGNPVSRKVQIAAGLLGTLTAVNLAVLQERTGRSQWAMLGRTASGAAVGYLASSIFAAVLGAWEKR